MPLQSENRFGDEAAFKRLKKGVSGSVNRITGGNFIANLLSGIFYFLIGLGAFSVRVVLRRKLGERSFGLLTILLTFISLRLFYAWNFVEISSCAELYGSECRTVQDLLYYVTFPVVLIGGIFFPNLFPTILKTQEGFGNAFNPFNLGLGESLAGFYSIVFLIFAFIALSESIYRIYKKIRWYSYYRGKSSLFDRWLTGKKIGGFVITERIIWMIVEPLTVVFFSGLFHFIGDTMLSQIFMLGAVCLFIEEYGDYQEERNIILNVIDGEIINERIIALKAEYNIDQEPHYKGKDDRNASDSELTI